MSVIQLPRTHQDEAGVAETSSDVDIVIPVYNEAGQLAPSIATLRSYLDSSFPFVSTITIADNASTDDTWQIALDLADTLPRVRAVHLDQKGRGRALRAAWAGSTAPVVSYMDVDLATGLDALLPLVAPLLSGHSDLAIGSRLAPGAHVVRGARREFISRGYNLLLRTALRSSCTDAQCGFKAMRREAAAELLPLVEDDAWFFDTEILITAQRIGLRIHEVPVDWVDDVDSRVQVAHTAWLDLRGVWRMMGPTSRQRAVLRPARPAALRGTGPGSSSNGVSPVGGSGRTGRGVAGNGAGARPHAIGTFGTVTATTDPEVFADELLRFAGVGVVSTLAYVGLFAALEPGLGSYAANALAIGLCSLGNTAAHRGMAGTARHGLDRSHRVATGAALLAISLSFTTGALAATRALGLTSLLPELCAVSVANVGAAVIRFGILRTWVFRPAFGTHLAAAPGMLGTGDHVDGGPTMTGTPR
ncbi:MAG: glycosyltransferase [Acidimicrobiales bacterium]|jgi:putative flippase GtrA